MTWTGLDAVKVQVTFDLEAGARLPPGSSQSTDDWGSPSAWCRFPSVPPGPGRTARRRAECWTGEPAPWSSGRTTPPRSSAHLPRHRERHLTTRGSPGAPLRAAFTSPRVPHRRVHLAAAATAATISPTSALPLLLTPRLHFSRQPCSRASRRRSSSRPPLRATPRRPRLHHLQQPERHSPPHTRAARRPERRWGPPSLIYALVMGGSPGAPLRAAAQI